MPQDQPGGPLAGIRVVEAASYITGPYAAQLLADLGADVVKLEEPSRGDAFRAWGAGLYSPTFVGYNRNKRSLTLNLRAEGAAAVIERLAGWADVFLENYRPGVADRLGIGWERLHALNPRLVYCSISGAGQTGPYAQRPSYDTIGQALSGMLSLLVDPAQPKLVGPAFSDSLTGLFACYGVLAALCARAQTGEGQRVETSMLQATLAFQLEPHLAYRGFGRMPGPSTRQATSQSYAFRCADGRGIALHLSSPPKFWEGLVRTLGREDLLTDPRFVTREGRAEHYDAIQHELAPVFASRPRDEWLAALRTADVPVAPIYDMGEALADPQVEHLGMEHTVEHPTDGEQRLLGYPVKLGGTPLPPPRRPPTLGEHTADMLEALGFTAEAVEGLRAKGII